MWIKRKEYELLFAKLDRLQKEKKQAIYSADEAIKEKDEIIEEYQRTLKRFLIIERKTQNYKSVQNVLNKLETELEKIGGKHEKITI